MSKEQFKLWFDTETTGLSAQKHGLVELGGMVVKGDEVLEEFLFKMCPTGKGATKQALAVTGYTIEQIKALTPWEEVFPEVISLFDRYINRYDKEHRFIACGQNIKFDLKMLNGFFKSQGDHYMYAYIDSKQVIDTLPLARRMQKEGIIPNLKNNKLCTLCEYFDVDLTNAHTAIADIKATREVYLKMEKLIKSKNN